jgi:hypothetical protein
MARTRIHCTLYALFYRLVREIVCEEAVKCRRQLNVEGKSFYRLQSEAVGALHQALVFSAFDF